LKEPFHNEISFFKTKRRPSRFGERCSSKRLKISIISIISLLILVTIVMIPALLDHLNSGNTTTATAITILPTTTSTTAKSVTVNFGTNITCFKSHNGNLDLFTG
jgi:hypothetical protein